MSNNAGDGGLEIPIELRSQFSDAQAEELVSQFQQSDADSSGSIDEHEFCALLARMSLSVTDAEAAELVESIDTNGNGLIDFQELVVMVVQIKKGDDRFRALKKFVDALDTTPIAALEREAKKFGLQIQYQLIDERKATSSTPPQFVMELVISGKWCGTKGAERLQAIGRTTREAKFKAAEAGLTRVKKLKPGLAYDLGYLPPDWEKWLFDNLEKGGGMKKLLEILTQKGFSPANSNTLVQRISSRVSSHRLRTRRSAPKSMYEAKKGSEVKARVSANALHPQWVHWSQQELERGIEGRIVLEELIAFGYDPEKNPLFTQTLLRGASQSGARSRDSDCRDDNQSALAGGTVTSTISSGGASMSHDRRYTFLKCLEDGNLSEVELFVFAGQDVNAKIVDPNSHVALTPLHIACKLGYGAIVHFLLNHGAKVDLVDGFHRTPLMVAARNSYFDVCEQLIKHDASIFKFDNLNNTPLHMAAYGGCAKIVDLVLRTHDEMLLLFIANLPHKCAVSYGSLLQDTYDVIMKKKLRENERRRFHISWVFEAVQWMHHRLFLEKEEGRGEGASGNIRDIPRPQKFFLDHLIEQYHNKLSKKSADVDEEVDEEEKDPDREKDATDWISLQEMTFYVDKCLRETFKHLPNKQGRTALHVACDENLVCTHELAIQCLAEKHGCSPLFRDHSGHTPIELALSFRNRPGSPKGDTPLEMTYISNREERLRLKKERQEKERTANRRKRWQDELEKMAQDFNDIETLGEMRKLVKQQGPPKQHINGWDVYDEPLSGNRLFENVKSGFVQRQVPAKVLETSSKRFGWKEKLELHSHFVERNRLKPDWELHRVNSTDVYFFFNRERLHCQWVKPKEAPSEWRTKRIFDNDEQFEDEEDQASLVVMFSGKATAAITKDAARGRRLGAWRECVCFSVTFYLRGSDDSEGEEEVLALDKPQEVLLHESFRYAEVLIRARSEEIEEHHGGWKRYYDPVTSHTFYYDEFSGECVHDTFATPTFLMGIRKPRPKSRFALTKEELQRRKEEAEWKSALQRARRHEEHAKESELQAEQHVQQSELQSEELQKATQKLEMSVTSEHLNVNGKGLAYVDARYRRELEIFLEAQKNGLLTSVDPARESPRDEIERANTVEKELDDEERESAAIEDVDASRASRERRRVSRLLCRTAERMKADMELCRWGCERWFPRVRSLETHERDECHRRRMVCRLGCALVCEHQQWRRGVYEHEAEKDTKCDSRIVFCPRDCGVWVSHLHLAHHMRELCMKRPVGDLLCRLGCGKVYQGGAHELLALEQTRIAHEQDDCELRKVECTWPKCRAIILAKERNAHRRNHLISSGVASFLTAEVHEFRVPKDMRLLKIQAWGAGGGSGHLKGQMVGHGGGGAFVEGICKVFPGETLYISIGSGGNCGKYARLRQIEFEEDDEDALAAAVGQLVVKRSSTGNDNDPPTTPLKKKKSKRIETFVGVAKGGFPGGGDGHSGNKETACGAGGGLTSVYRESAYGVEYLLIAAGGGGGGTCRPGDGGGTFKQRKFKDGDEVRMGRPGGDLSGGEAGECDEHNPICKFVGTDGASMQGGNGAEFGGGGGGGLFGGGGGGFAPGIVGGGGGGSSFVNWELFDRKSVRVEPGDTILPGGMDQNPPQSVRGAYWDVADGVVGEGGTSTVTALEKGNHGGVRLARPGFFNDMKFHR